MEKRLMRCGETWGASARYAIVLAALVACAPRAYLRSEGAPPTSPSAIVHHFNRNAFAASVQAGTGQLVALTDGGNLLVFDPNTFALVGERVPVTPVTCLGPARGSEVIVGLEDGRVVGVDVPSLKMKLLGTVMGQPLWIGRGPSGDLLVVRG